MDCFLSHVHRGGWCASDPGARRVFANLVRPSFSVFGYLFVNAFSCPAPKSIFRQYLSGSRLLPQHRSFPLVSLVEVKNSCTVQRPRSREKKVMILQSAGPAEAHQPWLLSCSSSDQVFPTYSSLLLFCLVFAFSEHLLRTIDNITTNWTICVQENVFRGHGGPPYCVKFREISQHSALEIEGCWEEAGKVDYYRWIIAVVPAPCLHGWGPPLTWWLLL